MAEEVIPRLYHGLPVLAVKGGATTVVLCHGTVYVVDLGSLVTDGIAFLSERGIVEKIHCLLERSVDPTPGLGDRKRSLGGIIGVGIVDRPALLCSGGYILKVCVALHQHHVADSLHCQCLGAAGTHSWILLDTLLGKEVKRLECGSELEYRGEIVAIVLDLLICSPISVVCKILIPSRVCSLIQSISFNHIARLAETAKLKIGFVSGSVGIATGDRSVVDVDVTRQRTNETCQNLLLSFLASIDEFCHLIIREIVRIVDIQQ